TTVLLPVAAKHETGNHALIDMTPPVADLHGLIAKSTTLAADTVIDAHLEKHRVPVATVLVQSGTLRIGDNLVVGHIFGKVRALLDDLGRKMKEAGPATPAVVTGLPDVPTAGDIFQVVSSAKVARTIAGQRAEQYRVA